MMYHLTIWGSSEKVARTYPNLTNSVVWARVSFEGDSDIANNPEDWNWDYLMESLLEFLEIEIDKPRKGILFLHERGKKGSIVPIWRGRLEPN